MPEDGQPQKGDTPAPDTIEGVYGKEGAQQGPQDPSRRRFLRNVGVASLGVTAAAHIVGPALIEHIRDAKYKEHQGLVTERLSQFIGQLVNLEHLANPRGRFFWRSLKEGEQDWFQTAAYDQLDFNGTLWSGQWYGDEPLTELNPPDIERINLKCRFHPHNPSSHQEPLVSVPLYNSDGTISLPPQIINVGEFDYAGLEIPIPFGWYNKSASTNNQCGRV